MTASKSIKKTNAVTGTQVNTVKTSVFALFNAIRTLAKADVVVERTYAMAA